MSETPTTPIPVTPTAALRLVPALRAIADHLAAYPELSAPHISSYLGSHLRLQLSGPWANELPNLTAWARSLGVTDLEVRYCGPGRAAAHVHAVAEIAPGLFVDIWDAVPALDHSDLGDNATVAVADAFRLAADTAARLASEAVLAGQPA